MKPELAPLRRFVTCLDGRRIPLNAEQRAHRRGSIPYWGANGVVDEVDDFLFDEQLVLLGEDGAPFDEPNRDVAFLVEGRIWVNNHIHVLRPAQGIDARFLTYALNAIDWVPHVGGSTRLKLTQDDMMAVMLPRPSLADQRAIADYLDAETARIDALIAKKWKLVQVLRERFVAFREKALWADATPTPLHRLTDPLRPIVYGIVQAGPDIEGGVPYIKTGDLGILGEPHRLSRTSHEVDEQYRRSRVRPGDIVVAMRASIGEAVLVPPALTSANLTQGTARIAAARGVDPRWLLHAFRSQLAQEQCDLRAVGSTFRTLNIWDLRRVEVPVPIDHDFARIRLVLDEAQTVSARAIDGIIRQVDLLRQHRQALITAAVTEDLRLTGAA